MLLFAFPAWEQAATPQSPEPAKIKDLKLNHDVGPELATVTASVARRRIRPGENLAVKLTITAGPRGAWLPNAFADWDKTCQSGFSIQFLTLDGQNAWNEAHGCAGDFLGPGPPAEQLLTDYVFLKPGESRSWRTTLAQLTRKPGAYEVRAEYFSAQIRIEEVGALPAVHGLMVIGHVKAKPVSILIQ